MTGASKASSAMQLPRKFFALLILDAVTLLVAATLLLRSFWEPAMVIAAALFVANVFLVPAVFRTQKSGNRASDKGRSKVWFWGLALLAAALIRSALFMQSGFSWPGFAGVIAGILLGTLFLFIAKKSR